MSNETTARLERDEIVAFARDWYRKLDEHAPTAELLPLLAEQGLEFRLPEGVLTTQDAFRAWYEGGRWYEGGQDLPGVINQFFDEVHTLGQVEVDWRDERALVTVVVNWQFRRWRPPAPRSEWGGFDAYQRWEMIRSPATGRPVIAGYAVDKLQPMPGSRPL